MHESVVPIFLGLRSNGEIWIDGKGGYSNGPQSFVIELSCLFFGKPDMYLPLCCLNYLLPGIAWGQSTANENRLENHL